MKHIGLAALMLIGLLGSAVCGSAATAVVSVELVDSSTDTILRDLSDGDVICFPADGTQLNILATTSPLIVGSVQFSYDGDENYHIENNSPYCIGDDTFGDFNDWTPALGEHWLVITPYTQPDASGTAGTPIALSFTVIDGYPQVSQLVLINSTTDTDIRTLANGATINFAVDGSLLNIRADTNPTSVGSVRFNYDGIADYAIENAAPYALEGDDPIGDYKDWTPSLGSHTLIVVSYAGRGATGPSGSPMTVNFNVVNATPTPSPSITPSLTQSMTYTTTPVYSPTPSPTPSPTRTVSATHTGTRTASPTGTLTRTPSPTASPSRTPSPSATASPTVSPTGTQTPVLTPTQSPVVTATPTSTYTVTRTSTTVPTATATPTAWMLASDAVQAYPVPAKGDTLWFYYHVDGPADAVIRIYNVTGEKGEVLKAQHPAAGYQRTPWDIRQVAPGIYFYRLSVTGAGGRKAYPVKKLVVLKNQ